MCQTPASNPLLKLRLRTLGGVTFPATPARLPDRHLQTVIRLRGPRDPNVVTASGNIEYPVHYRYG